MIIAAIIACEIAFWVLLLSGLTARYVLRMARLSTVLLVCTPLTDVLLLAFTGVDLAGGASAQGEHGLAAVYLGFSVAFGPSLIAEADRRLARRFSTEPVEPRPRPTPRQRLTAHWRSWRRCLLACAIAAGVLAALVLIAGDAERSRTLWAGGGWFLQLGALCVGWLLLGPVWTATSKRLRHCTLSTRPEGGAR